LYGAYLDLQRSVTLDGYKLILYPKIKRMRLYNLRVDPGEMNDLATDEKSRPMIEKLFARFLELQSEVGDTLDLKSVYGEI